MADKIDAILALRGADNLSVGRERIRLLEAVAEHGSINKAARVLGYSYKYAWDSVTAINNLLPRPALVTQIGGYKGGGTALTDEGRRLIQAFHRLEERLAGITARIARDGIGDETDLLFWSSAMRTSARNVLRCAVTSVVLEAVNARVVLQVTDAITMTAMVTKESAEMMDLKPGRRVAALVNSSLVLLARGDSQRLPVSARNRIPGTVAERIAGPVNTEVTLLIGEGKTITSVITHEAADELDLRPGRAAWALFKASQVILAAD